MLHIVAAVGPGCSCWKQSTATVARQHQWASIGHLPHCPAPTQHIRDIVDPEHPYTLEQLNVVTEEQVEVDDAAGTVQVRCNLGSAEVGGELRTAGRLG